MIGDKSGLRKISVILDDGEEAILEKMLDTKEAEDISNAVRICIRAYTPKISKEVST